MYWAASLAHDALLYATMTAASIVFLAAGLDEGLPSLNVSNLLYMENPHSYKKFQ